MKHDEQHNETGFFLPNRELSWVIALALIMSFVMFCAGYFFGQRRAITQFLYKSKEESFADTITYSLYTMAGKELVEEDDSEESTVEEPVVDDEAHSENDQEIEISSENKKDSPTESIVTYVAPLVGFGTLHAANSFAQRVKKDGIDVIVKQRSSKTQRGRRIVWYQAVTQEYEDKAELETIINRVKQKEHIKEVKIIEKRKVNHSC